MRFMSTILLAHTRHYISGQIFIAIIFLFPFLSSFLWHNSEKRKGHTLMPRWFIALIPEGTIDLNNLWLKCISSSAFSFVLKLNKWRNIQHEVPVIYSESPARGRRLISSWTSRRSQDRTISDLIRIVFQLLPVDMAPWQGLLCRQAWLHLSLRAPKLAWK